MSEQRRIAIGEAHRRGIATTLALLDEMLCRFRRWADGYVARGVLYEERGSLGRAQRKAIRGEIAAVRDLLEELRETLCLPVRTQDTRDAVWSQASAYWEAIVELDSRRLRRYGDVPGELAEYLDPKVEELAARLLRIAATAGRHDGGDPPCPAD